MVDPTPLRPASLYEEVPARLRSMVFDRALETGQWPSLAGWWSASAPCLTRNRAFSLTTCCATENLLHAFPHSRLCPLASSRRGDSGPAEVARVARWAEAREALMTACQDDLESLAMAIALCAASDEAMQALTRICACYLGFYSPSTGGDPVARFHLDNGARLERLNALGDLFTKGVKQSFGVMVNHLYDL